jgi:hypothetical protein
VALDTRASSSSNAWVGRVLAEMPAFELGSGGERGSKVGCAVYFNNVDRLPMCVSPSEFGRPRRRHHTCALFNSRPYQDAFPDGETGNEKEAAQCFLQAC